jgi:hypothetical protein
MAPTTRTTEAWPVGESVILPNGEVGGIASIAYSAARGGWWFVLVVMPNGVFKNFSAGQLVML